MKRATAAEIAPMLIVSHTINVLLMIVLPLALALWLAGRLKLEWRLWRVGALTFVASQLLRLPILFGLTALFARGILPSPGQESAFLFNAAVLSLSAGLFEEGARYVAYRWFLKRDRRWRPALMFGAGHGGIEAILLGAVTGYTMAQMIALRSVDVSTLGLPTQQQATVAAQVATYWAAAWYATLLGAVERAFALCVHLSLAVLVLQTFTRKQWWWWIAAVLWHTVVNFSAVVVLQELGPYWAEATVGIMALLSVGIVVAFKPAAGTETHGPELPLVVDEPASRPPADDREAAFRRKVDKSRYEPPR